MSKVIAKHVAKAAKVSTSAKGKAGLKAKLTAKGKAAAAKPAAAPKPVSARQAVENSAAAGNLPTPPAFWGSECNNGKGRHDSSNTHYPWIGFHDAVAALISAKDVAALESIATEDSGPEGRPNLVARSTSPTALIKWARLAAVALRAQKVKPAKPAGAFARAAKAIAEARSALNAERQGNRAAEVAAAAAAKAKAEKAAAKAKGKPAPVATKARQPAPVAAKAPVSVKRGKPTKADRQARLRK